MKLSLESRIFFSRSCSCFFSCLLDFSFSGAAAAVAGVTVTLRSTDEEEQECSKLLLQLGVLRRLPPTPVPTTISREASSSSSSISAAWEMLIRLKNAPFLAT
jgi:hypothetical protein